MSDKIAIVIGAFHRERANRMLDEARRVAAELDLEIVKEVWVPGSFEIPLALKHLLENESIKGAAVLGIIERGETKHGLVMAQAVFPAIIELQLEHDKPVGLGIIGPEVTEEQIEPRLLPHAGAAARAIRKMLDVL